MSQRPGWYDDPHDPTHLRYYDGVLWTDHRAPKTSPTAASSQIGRAPSVATRTDPGAPGSPAPTYGGQGPADGSSYGGPGWQSYAPTGQGYQGAGVPVTPDFVPLASWGRRLAAYLIDNIIQGIIVTVVGAKWISDFATWYLNYVQQAVDQSQSGRTPVIDNAAITAQVQTSLLPLSLIGLLVFIVYQAAFLATLGATPGKLALGIRVRRWDRAGKPDLLTVGRRLALPIVVQLIQALSITVDRGNLGLSAIVSLVSLVVGVLGFVDYLWPLWDKRRQTLHDKIAASAVVKPGGSGR